MTSAYSPTGSQPPSVEVIVRQGLQPGQRFSLTKQAIIIGRDEGNDVVISHSEVSRRHASLTWDGTRFTIQDLGSANGTFVNGRRLTAPHALQPGDVIGLGPTVQLDFQTPFAAPPVSDPREAPTYVDPRTPAPPPARRGGRRITLPLLAALLGLCGLLALGAVLGFLILRPGEVNRPLVQINSPRHGEQVQVGQEVTIHSVARGEENVTRVELWIDGRLQKSQASALPGGTSPFPLVVRWQPSSPGTHTLIARAFNAQGGQGQASVNVEATEANADQDSDEVTDEADACPDEPGPAAASGCPDQDGDSVSDYLDDCPHEAGTPATEGCPDADGDALRDDIDACPDEPGAPGAPEGDGCPAPTDEDSDGDGISDAEDESPDDPGSPFAGGSPDADGDGVADSDDHCPDQPGPAEHDGCPGLIEVVDTDHDGITDEHDDCPLVPGAPAHNGCPDSDGDGVRDRDDACPHEPGPAPGGCPDRGIGDRDGDGIPDDVDECPDEAGPGPSGCPPPEPGGGGEPPGGPFGDRGFFEPLPLAPGGNDLIILRPVEFEALEFEVNHDYDEVWCYGSLAGGEWERYEDFEPPGEGRWDIAAILGGENSRVVAVPEGEDLQVQLECGASNINEMEVDSDGGIPEGSAWGTVWDLGSFTRNHPPPWTGDDIIVDSELGSEGHAFRVKYRLCADACDEAALRPPILHYGGFGSQRWLRWTWEGDRESIDGFKLYINHNFMWEVGSEESSENITFSVPRCDEHHVFNVTAYIGNPRNPDRESPFSNPAVRYGQRCELPDLIPTDVTVHDGQLRIHILNQGGPLRSEDVTIRFETLVSRALIDTHTWPAVTIPAGATRFPQTSEVVEPLPLRVIVDPDDTIEELNEDNNAYAMPVVMRVEFLQAYSPFSNEGGCSIFTCDSEHYFYLSAGHGSSWDAASWESWRFPRTGVLESRCTSDLRGCDESPREAWNMEGDDRYTYEFEVPPDENLYIMVTGMEADNLSSDDLVGRLRFSYPPSQNWGAEAGIGNPKGYSERTSNSDIQASWRITRVR